MNTLSHTYDLSLVLNSVEKACEKLKLTPPVNPTHHLPAIDGKIQSVIVSSCIFFQKQTDDLQLLMVHQKYKKNSCAFPGGFRAGAPEDKWSKFDTLEVENEEYFPLYTAAREISEELPFFFDENGQVNTASAYQYLNQTSVHFAKNGSWDSYPVAMYIAPLNDHFIQKVAEALNGKMDFKTNLEVSAVSMISLKTLKAAYAAKNWSLEGLSQRAHLISEAKKQEQTADLRSYQQYDQNLMVKNSLDQVVTILAYTARSIFTVLPELEKI